MATAASAPSPSQHKAHMAVEAPQTFKFINISNPAQAKEKKRKESVRRYVRPVPRRISSRKEDERGDVGRSTFNFEVADEGLAFVTTTHPDQVKSGKVRTFVKQNSQRRGEKRERRQQNGNGASWTTLTIVNSGLEIGNLSQRKSSPPRDHGPDSGIGIKRAVELEGENITIVCDHSTWPRRFVKNSPYPIKMNSELNQIVHYLHTDSKVTQVPPSFLASWFAIIIQDTAAFQSLLSLATKQQSLVHGVKPSRIGLQLYTNALTSVNKRLSKPTEQASIGVLTTVLMFLVMDVLCLDFPRYKINRDGIQRIITVKGGIQSLDGHLTQRIFLLVMEMFGSYLFDYPPTYYLDGALTQQAQISPPHTSMPLRLDGQLVILRSKSPTHDTLHIALQYLYALSTHMDRSGPGTFVHNIATQPGVYTTAVQSFQILEETKNSLMSKDNKAFISTICYAIVFALNTFRVAMCDFPTTVNLNLIKRMRHDIEVGSHLWEGLEDLYLWCLVQGGIINMGEDRMFFVRKVKETMKTRGIKDWKSVMEVLEDMFFVELLFVKDYGLFGEEVLIV